MKKEKIKTIECNKKIILLLSILMLSVFISFRYIKADTASDNAKKIKELEEKSKIYQQIIELKQKQENTLDNQVAILEAETNKLESEAEAKKDEIEELNKKITDLEDQIDDTEVSIRLQRKILAELIQAYYENKDQDIVVALLIDKTLASFMAREDRFIQIEDKTNEILKNIKSLKDGLENEKKTVEAEKKKVTDLFYELQEKSSDLQDKKEQKQVLIAQTQGEQSKYEKLLKKIEEQKQELLNIDELGSGLSADAYAKPPASAFASTNWYYSQRDPRWGSQTIGNTRTLLKSYGCAVAAVSMIFTYHGDSITPGTLAKKKVFSSDLIVWPASSFGGKVSMSGSYSHGNINWSTVDAEIKKGNPVIVYIKKTKGNGGHYVAVHTKMSNGKYIVHDPYWGANIYLDTTRALMGKMNPASGTVIDQMIVYRKK